MVIQLPKVYQEHYFMVTWKPLLKSVLLQRYLRSALCGAYFVYLCLLVSPAEPPFLKKVVIEESRVFLCYAWNYTVLSTKLSPPCGCLQLYTSAQTTFLKPKNNVLIRH